MPLDAILTDPDALKARFKEQDRLQQPKNTNWSIRTHRAISWYRRAMEVSAHGDESRDLVEARLLFLWISLNALFGRWSAEERRPFPEGPAMALFFDEVMRMDRSDTLMDCVGQSLPAVKRLLANPYLHYDFWINPFDASLADRMVKSEGYLKLPLSRDRASSILREALDRIYLLRSQIVHGASTSGSKLNRQSLSDSLRLLQRLVPAVINIVIEAGSDREWPPLCYPPIDPQNKSTLLGI